MTVNVVRNFNLGDFAFAWINAISKVGYLALTGCGDEAFVGLWTIGERAGQFFRTNENVRAEAVGYHYFEKPGCPARLFVIPRFTDDYEDNNMVYSIAEADEQKETSSVEIIEPLVKQLELYLSPPKE